MVDLRKLEKTVAEKSGSSEAQEVTEQLKYLIKNLQYHTLIMDWIGSREAEQAEPGDDGFTERDEPEANQPWRRSLRSASRGRDDDNDSTVMLNMSSKTPRKHCRNTQYLIKQEMNWMARYAPNLTLST